MAILVGMAIGSEAAKNDLLEFHTDQLNFIRKKTDDV